MKKTRRTDIIIAILGVLLLLTAGLGFYSYFSELKENQELKSKLAQLTKEEQRSAIMQRINAQMEEIATEQGRISDEQRKEAEEQALVAQRERENAEEQRRQAEQERQNALIAERKAITASETAEKERIIAEQQRAQAELSKRTTDTLSYLLLARTLGNNAITQYEGGNHELADLLAYTAVMFTQRYHGDINSTTVYQALALTSQNKNVWNKHKGSVMDIAFYDKPSVDFVSCSTYGEVMIHHLKGDKLTSEKVFDNKQFDFRDIYINRETKDIYAVSRNSQLVIIYANKKHKVINVNLPKLICMEPDGNYFYVFAEQGMALFNPEKEIIEKEKALNFKIERIGVTYGCPLLFDDKKQMHKVESFGKITTEPVPFKDVQITAYAESKNQHTKAYGTKDGMLYFINSKGEITKLAGHKSRITKIKINGHRLYTSSYDGTQNVWLTNQSKIEPMTLFRTSGWIINFTYDLRKTNIWTGDQNGNLTKALISQSEMIKRLKSKLKRNMTQAEWEYFVGKKVPYENLIRKEVKR